MFQPSTREDHQTGSKILPPKRYNQVRDKIVMNNLDSNQRHKEPSEAEKYPKKHIQKDIHHYEGFSHNYMVDLSSERPSQGGLAKQLNQQHNAMQHHVHPDPHVPQILVTSQPDAGHQAKIGKFKNLNNNST